MSFMWQCPKCGRTFENENADHQCIDTLTPIDAYIAEQPESIQPYLNQIRDTIRAALPKAQERISWRMPTYWDKRNIIHFAAHKNHVGLYPGPEAIVHFSEELKEYSTSKGAIQFPYHQQIPLALIREIAKWCYETGHHH
jgi:uncharacterized protein YdhG (YjbR/CyaY superfamily)